MEQRPARSRCFNSLFVFEYLIYSSTTLNIKDKLCECQRIFVTFFTKTVYKSSALLRLYCYNIEIRRG